ncbi:MAG: hypothetical protein K2L70_02415 [Clostridia bacterium]|nr:hypothetical protein [Clostridia bacterium]
MTKREKIAISVSAILDFAAFCIALAPISFLLGYVFGEQTCFMRVQYDKLPYAMGEDYLYVPLEFFEEWDYHLSDNTASIRYNGKWGQYKDCSFEKPIPKTWEYFCEFKKYYDDECYPFIQLGCSRVNMKNYDESSYDLTYGQYKYKVVPQIESDGEGNAMCYVDYDVCARADSGSICNLSITIYDFELADDLSKETGKSGLKYQEIFEGLLDNLVGYSHFQ